MTGVITNNIRERFDNNVNFILNCFEETLIKAEQPEQTLSKDNLIQVYQTAASLTIAETIEKCMREK